jgi:transposase
MREQLHALGGRYVNESGQLEEVRRAMAQLARILVSQGITASEVAGLAGVSRKTVHGWLRKEQT